jgi:hypothetical protein
MEDCEFSERICILCVQYIRLVAFFQPVFRTVNCLQQIIYGFMFFYEIDNFLNVVQTVGRPPGIGPTRWAAISHWAPPLCSRK